ncbi:nitrate reductase [Belnapia rosea]|uniref:Assimilatory nitrate reductase (NADH) alpha subunit apoprotein n=1 Tax=Belnapia rosea TaxID=938405 RepID=A0A1G6P9Y2_9PROT|nr:molybdopterin-dependent oxidoreductase [Belnapia rosea]SDC76791.1 assimilatory nitrate reductase (NADH) alpha subunit apoprotein [Belnapia rosea]
MAETRTTCPYCGVGCGVLASADGTLRGDPEHPANRGRLCSKGTALGETLDQPGRLLHPEVDGKRASWDAALDAVAEGFRRALAEGGPQGTALYVSGQLLTEDYYAANKLAKGFLGTGNIDSNSRLCMASAVAGHRRAFGEDLVPGIYEDLELADLVVLVGSNLAWCHPILFQRLQAARAARPAMRLVVIDPRRTASCEGADLHLPIPPGCDVALFNTLLRHLHAQGFRSTAPGLAEAVAQADGDTGLDPAALATFLDWFATTPRTVTLFSQGANQSSAGTDKANAIINCHLLAGHIGQPGAGPFSITGQPNAMGGREVGALANTLAGHLDWAVPAEAAALRDYWQAPNLAAGPGLKAVDLFRAAGEGRIGALWVMATNPAISLPDAGRVREALRRTPCLVASDCTRESDTVDLARIRLPALGWGEKSGTVTNSERVISRQRAFRPAPGEARPDWWAIAQVAARLGWGEAFAWSGPAAIFREHAALTGLARPAARAFDISGLADLSDADYAAMPPTRWPVARRGEQGGRLAPPARFVATPFRPPANATSAEYPLALLTGRLRDQWHSMTRTGPVPRLMAHSPEPTAAIHPADAAGLPDGSLARLDSPWGSATLRLRHDPGIARGGVFVPMHWTARFAPAARINISVNPAVDPVSGQPELKHTPVRLGPAPMAWHGFLLARRSLGAELADWTALIPEGPGLWRHELAGGEAPAEAFARLRALVEEPDAAWVLLEDPAAGLHRAALVRDGRLLACLFLAPDPAGLPPRGWLAGLFAEAAIGSAARRALLAGTPADGPAPSPTLCVCHGVTAAVICSSIARGANTPALVGEATKAGTGCGSCRPEIAALLAATPVPEPA